MGRVSIFIIMDREWGMVQKLFHNGENLFEPYGPVSWLYNEGCINKCILRN